MPKLTIKEWAEEILAVFFFTLILIGLPFFMAALIEVTQ